MTPKQVKLVYSLFCSFFVIWLILIVSTVLLNGGALPLRFPNYIMLTLFIVSAGLSSAPAMMLGLDFIGINFNRRGKKISNKTIASVTIKRRQKPQPTTPTILMKETIEEAPWILTENDHGALELKLVDTNPPVSYEEAPAQKPPTKPRSERTRKQKNKDD